MKNGYILVNSVEAIDENYFQLYGVKFENPNGTAFVEDIAFGWKLYMSVWDINTGFPVSGLVQKYKVELVSNVDTGLSTFDCLIKYDEVTPSSYLPLGGYVYPISEPTINSGLGMPNILSDYTIDGVPMPPNIISGVLLTDMKNVVDTSLLKDNVKYYEVGAGNSILGRVAAKTLDNTVVLASNTDKQTSNVVGIFLESKVTGEKARILKFGAIPKDIIEEDDFIENALPSDGEWVYLSHTEGRLTVSPTEAPGSWQIFLGAWDNGILNLHVVPWGQA